MHVELFLSLPQESYERLMEAASAVDLPTETYAELMLESGLGGRFRFEAVGPWLIHSGARPIALFFDRDKKLSN